MTDNQHPPEEDSLSEKRTELPSEVALEPAGDRGGSERFLIAALGASAGGLEAFENFFRHMPADAGVGIIVVQHLAPDHASALPELLARYTPMPVEQARDHTTVAPNRVYIIPPNATLTIQNGILYVASPAEPRGHRMPIDSLFRSLAQDRGEDAVCIILSGTGTDGTIGLRAIKEYGGMAMAQTLESAQYDTILRSAIATGLVDHILPVEEMPAKLLEYAAYLSSSDGNTSDIGEQVAPYIGKIHSLIRRRAGHDFSQYKESTITRRLQRRLKALQIETVEQYVQVLESKPEEADKLFKDLLIGVTQFFRDAEAFEMLGRDIVPKLFEGKDANAQVRVCVVGCATGEEAYSIAILLCEHAATLENAPKLKVFATDIDDRGLEMARKGRYPESIAEHVTPERLERFFAKQGSAYQVKRELREICIFSNHSFIKDPPFSRLDLISCRNVMIYLGMDLQRKIIPLFHYALRDGGYLFLGPSESASSHRELFLTVDKKNRIFQKKQTLQRHVVGFPLVDISRPKEARGQPPETEEQNIKQLERVILQRYRPACVAVQENGDAVYFSGRIGRYLEPATGSPDSNVISMARGGLRVPLRTALHKAVTTRERVVQKDIAVQTNGGFSQVDLAVEPIAEFHAANLYMIVFEDVTQGGSSTPSPHVFDASSEETIRHLEGELRSAQEHAQAMFEELESTNEEIRSANEEYQSTNEELETSKEEVQSFNEELETVNAELTRRVAELDHSNSDLQNLNASTQIATLFLDRELCIRNFTPAAASVFRMIPGDIGRPITDLAAQFANADFADDLREVLRTLVPRERDFPGTRDRHYLMRVLPYRKVHNVIDGVVVTFTDVTDLKHSEQVAESAKRAADDAKTYAESIVDTVREPILVLDSDLRVMSANHSFYEVFGVDPSETISRPLYDLGSGQWNIPDLRKHLNEILPEKKKMEDFRVDHAFPGIGQKTMLLNAREIPQQDGGARLILLAIEDVTANVQARDALVSLKEQLTADLAATRSLHAISTRLIGPGDLQVLLEEILDVAIEITGASFGNVQLLNRATGVLKIVAQRGFEREFLEFFDAVPAGIAACGMAMKKGERVIAEDVANDPIFRGTAAGEVMIRAGALAVQSTPLVSRSGEILGVFSTHYRSLYRPGERDLQRLDILVRQASDLVERKHAEDARARLAAIVESSEDAIVSKDLDGVIQTWNSGAERLFGYPAKEAIGQSITMLIPPGRENEEPAILESIRQGRAVEHYETIRRRKDGSLVEISLTVSPIVNEHGEIVGASKIARDTTEHQRMELERRDIAVAKALRATEAELARVARALTVGELATSIAHEVNQPLAALVTNAEACLRWLGSSEPNLHEAQESLTLIVRDANRASGVIRRIREFLKKDTPTTLVDMNDVVRETLDLVRDEFLKRRVTLLTQLEAGLPNVRGNRIQLQQVLLNLIMNGLDALATMEGRPREVAVISQKSIGNGIRVAVRDSGAGANPEDLDRMFNAFFTTKPAGIGMGLSISRSIIEAHGGHIWAEPNDGRGITVQFSLPVESEEPR